MSAIARVIVGVLMLAPVTAAAQNAPAVAPPAGAAQVPAPPTAAAVPAAAFSYNAEGRRDPFIDPLGTSPEGQLVSRGDGPAGLTLSEISISGVVQSRGVLIAMIQGPDKRTYLVHPGDKLADGVVTSVTPQGIIVLQDLQDRFANRRQQEVKKLLKSLEGAQD